MLLHHWRGHLFFALIADLIANAGSGDAMAFNHGGRGQLRVNELLGLLFLSYLATLSLFGHFGLHNGVLRED
mgnify:FL=1